MEDRLRHEKELDARLIELLEKQKKELVLRVLRKHEEVQAGKVFTDKIIANLSELFFIMTEGFNIVQVNEEFCRCLDYSLGGSKGLRLDQIVGQDSFEKIKNFIATGKVRNLETQFKSRTGSEIPVSLSGSTFVTGSGRVLHMMIATDKSDVYTMMSRIRESQEQLMHSERLASLGEMAAAIGHELTQPLNAILLFARNCLKALDKPDQNRSLLEENLNVIIDRVNKAASIIRSLRSFASKTSQKFLPVNVNSILTNILRFLDSQLKLSDIEVRLKLDRDIPLVLGQEVQLEQIFLNIIQNAIQAMGDTESPRLLIRTYVARSIDPESLSEKSYVATSIKDVGEGIPLEIRGKIFDPFFSTREVGLGMGLGLSIVDRIVRGLSGYIKVDSSPGKGSCFSIYLPAYREGAP